MFSVYLHKNTSVFRTVRSFFAVKIVHVRHGKPRGASEVGAGGGGEVNKRAKQTKDEDEGGGEGRGGGGKGRMRSQMPRGGGRTWKFYGEGREREGKDRGTARAVGRARALSQGTRFRFRLLASEARGPKHNQTNARISHSSGASRYHFFSSHGKSSSRQRYKKSATLFTYNNQCCICTWILFRDVTCISPLTASLHKKTPRCLRGTHKKNKKQSHIHPPHPT